VPSVATTGPGSSGAPWIAVYVVLCGNFVGSAGSIAGGIVVVGVATTGGGATLVAWLAPKGATMTTAMITTTTSRTPPIAQAIRYGRSSSRTDPGGR
jgi:hypothetical protein